MAEQFSLSLIVAGATRDKLLRAYVVYGDGLTEEIDSYGTIGSGAAYAELFLRFLVKEPEIRSSDARGLAVYAVKGVELMDPNVGGPVNTLTMTMEKDGLVCTPLRSENGSKAKMEQVLMNLSSGIQTLVEEEKPTMEEPVAGEVVEVISGVGRSK
jgi:20S proteasome alpha/beta subunit